MNDFQCDCSRIGDTRVRLSGMPAVLRDIVDLGSISTPPNGVFIPVCLGSRVSEHLPSQYPLVQLRLPAQPVDATPSSQLIRQYFPWRTDLFGCTRSKPSQGSVPGDLI